MKRIIVSLTVMLSSCLASSVQAKAVSDSETVIEVVPRLEVCSLPSSVTGDKPSVNLGQSSLYTFFDGEFGKYFSYSISNHWLSADPASLYRSTFKPAESGWLDWANISFNLNGFSLTAGKMAIVMGTFEFDPYDVDIHQNMVSTIWNNLSCYQWGAELSYSLPDESTSFVLQCLSSQFTEGRLFSDWLKTISFAWKGKYGIYQPYLSFNLFERSNNEFAKTLAFGNRFCVEDLTFDFNYLNKWVSGEKFLNDEMSFIINASYSISDAFEVGFMGGYEFCHGQEDIFGYGADWFFDGSIIPTGIAPDKDYLYGGLYFHYFPVEGLRIHANTAINNYANKPTFSVGVTYHLNILDLF